MLAGQSRRDFCTIENADRNIGRIQPSDALEHEGRVVFQVPGAERVLVGQANHVSAKHEKKVHRQIAGRDPEICDTAAAVELYVAEVINNDDGRGDAANAGQSPNICRHSQTVAQSAEDVGSTREKAIKQPRSQSHALVHIDSGGRERRVYRSNAAFRRLSCGTSGLPIDARSAVGAWMVLSRRRTFVCRLMERTIRSCNCCGSFSIMSSGPGSAALSLTLVFSRLA